MILRAIKNSIQGKKHGQIYTPNPQGIDWDAVGPWAWSEGETKMVVC